jgi:hypothetical protein
MYPNPCEPFNYYDSRHHHGYPSESERFAARTNAAEAVAFAWSVWTLWCYGGRIAYTVLAFVVLIPLVAFVPLFVANAFMCYASRGALTVALYALLRAMRARD